MMFRKILLTGSNGLLGQKILALLAGRENMQVIALGRGVDRYPIPGGYLYEEADMTDPGRMRDLFDLHQPTHVIHGAAMTMVDVCEDERQECWDANVGAVEILTALCEEKGTHLVHISTDFIFDGEEGPYKENDLPNPVNYYGESKMEAERVIQRSAVDYAILRTVLLYGVTPAMSRSNIVLWVKESLENGKPIRVVEDQFRSPTLAEDLASAAVLAVMSNAKGIFHISGPEMMTIFELAKKIADFWKLDKSLISPVLTADIKQKAKRPPRTGFVILKAQTELGYKPHTLMQGLQLLDRQIRELSNV